jgi:transcription elongation factor Elf1
MGGRKRKKVVKKVKKTIPKIFVCPNCGGKSLTISINKDEEKGGRVAIIKCGRCNISDTIEVANIEDTVDAYGKFIDRYYGVVKKENVEKS